MSKWYINEQSIYDENGNQIIESSEWYMRKDLQMICDEHNHLEKALELLAEFAFFRMDTSVDEHCEKAAKVQEFFKSSNLKCLNEYKKVVLYAERTKNLG